MYELWGLRMSAFVASALIYASFFVILALAVQFA